MGLTARPNHNILWFERVRASVSKEAIRCNGHLILPDLWAPDSERARAWASDPHGHLTLIQAVDLFLAAKAAEGISPKTSTWYRMILARLARAFDSDRPVDGLSAPEIRAWLLELRTTLAPVSVAGYVRTLKREAHGSDIGCRELA
jgi:hypothetical protein